MTEYEIFELESGIRIVHRQVTNTKIAHCAIMLDIGSRDEKPHQQGIAHFWEHMAFKGTKKRKAFHVINRLESVGGELNAYTTKEKICFYASVLDDHFSKAVELLSDITFNSIFPEAQLNKEREVILEEMSMYQDSPEDAIQDELDALIFDGHQLGKNILGHVESVNGFNRKHILDFIEDNIDTSRLVISSVGPFSLRKIKKIMERHFGGIPQVKKERIRVSPNGHNIKNEVVNKDILQSHIALGRRAFDMHSASKIPFFVLNNIFGGHSLNSKLNMALREQNGFVYNIESNFHAMTDSGYFTLFYATDPKKLKRSLELVEREMTKLKKIELGQRQLQSAKDQIKGQLAMAEENNQNYMLMMAKNLLDYNKINSLESVFEKIDAVTSTQLKTLSNEMLNMEEMSALKYIP
ncbi:MAG: insulinase family protein [Reichenbachiella sp.]